MNNKDNNKQFCCHLNSALREIYYEQIMGKKGHSSGYYTTYYYLLKEYKKQGQLCPKCLDFTDRIWDIYLTARQKIRTN